MKISLLLREEAQPTQSQKLAAAAAMSDGKLTDGKLARPKPSKKKSKPRRAAALVHA